MNGSPIPVSDFLSNRGDQLVNAASIVGRSADRQKVFEAVYKGKTQIKTIDYIKKITGLSNVRILQEGAKMCPMLMEKVKGGYKKKIEFSTLYKKILALAKDKEKIQRIATKAKVGSHQGPLININFPKEANQAKFLTIDSIRSFSKIRGVVNSLDTTSYREKKIKKAFQQIVGERGSFKDWGGERSDLYTTRIVLKNARIPTAIAFKGRGTKGKLVPAKMGKNGDQIGRLFSEPAQLFLIVYNGQIDSSIISQMKAFAIGNALGGSRSIYFGVIDENDLGRLANAYPTAFSKQND